MQAPKRSSYFQRKQRGLRAGLVFLLLSALVVGLWAILAPRSFYNDFPGLGMNWVRPIPKYNEHLIRDFGGLNLAFAFLFAWAAVTLDRRITQVVSIAYLFFAIPHLIFHAFHLGPLSTQEAVLQMISLSALVFVPLVLIVRSSRQDRWAIKNTARFSSGR